MVIPSMSLVKGAFIVRNVVITKQKPILFKMQEGRNNHNSILMNKIVSFKDFLSKSVREVENSIFNKILDLDDKLVWISWLVEVSTISEWFNTQGAEKLQSITNELERRMITEDSYKRINETIDYQIKTAINLLRDEVNLSNIQSMVSYFSEVPGYLDFDINIESLPRVTSKKTVTFKKHVFYIEEDKYSIQTSIYNKLDIA